MKATKIIAGAGGTVERYRYRRADDKRAWQSIEEALAVEGGSFSDRRRVHRAIRGAIGWYRGWCSVWNGSPRPGVVGRRIEEVRHAADALDRKLGALTDAELALLRAADIRSGRNWLSDNSGFRGPVLDLIRLSGSILVSLPAQGGGRPEDLPKRRLVERLAEIYLRETGQPAGVGWEYDEFDSPFTTLVSIVLILAGDEGTDDGLGKAIQRILSDMTRAKT